MEGQSSQGSPVEASAPEWTPNWKVKVMDKEHEIPEFMRSAITNAELEKQAREIFEKAYGLDYVKPKYLETREELQKIKPEFESQKQWIQSLGGMLQKGDFKSFAKQLKIPKELVYQYALEELQYEQLPPEQRQAMEQQEVMQTRLSQAEAQLRQMAQMREQEQAQARGAQVDSLLSQEGVKEVAEQFNSRMAQKGIQKNFRDLVVEQGYLLSTRSGKDVSVQEAIQAAMALTAFEEAKPATQAAAPAPVIPHIAGRGSASGKRSAKSIDDLKKRYEELQ